MDNLTGRRMSVITRLIYVLSFVALSFVSTLAASVEVSSKGKGEALLFPLYTAQNGWDTYLNVFTQGGLIHVKFRSAENGEVLDSFNVYGGAHHTFRASLTYISEGNAVMRIAEGQCVVGGKANSTALQHGGVGTDFPLSADVGTIEVFATGLMMEGTLPHQGRFGVNCEDYAAAWQTGGKWNNDPNIGVSAERYDTEIRGNVNFVNVQQGLSSSNDATALAETGLQLPHEHPTTNSTDLWAVTGGIDAVAEALSVTSYEHDVIVERIIQARTQAIVSFPLTGYKEYKPIKGEEFFEVVDDQLACNVWITNGHGDLFNSVKSESIDGSTRETDGNDQYFDGLHPPPFASECKAIVVANAGRDDGGVNLVTDSDLIEGNPHLDFINSYGTVTRFYWDRTKDAPRKMPMIGFRLTTFLNGELDGGKLANYSTIADFKYYCVNRDDSLCGR